MFNFIILCSTILNIEVIWVRKTTLLKKLINDPEILVMPGAYDVLSARLIEAAGFKAVQCSGFGFAASLLGLPDIRR